MITYAVPAIRCSECRLVFEPSPGTRLLRILVCVVAFALIGFAVTREEYLGMSTWHPYSRYVVVFSALAIFTLATLLSRP